MNSHPEFVSKNYLSFLAVCLFDNDNCIRQRSLKICSQLFQHRSKLEHESSATLEKFATDIKDRILEMAVDKHVDAFSVLSSILK